MEKMITIFTEVAVAAIILFGLVAMASGLMNSGADGTSAGAIYTGIQSLISEIFNAAESAATSGIPQ